MSGTPPIPQAESRSWKSGAMLVAATRRTFPVVSISLVFRGGSTADPAGKEGLASLTTRLLERGTAKRSREQIADAIETMGGTFGAGAAPESMRLNGSVLSRNLDAYFAVLAEILLQPAFDEEELAQAKDEMLAELALWREEDRDLGDAYFRRAVYGENAYGRFPEGTEATIPTITREDVVARWRASFTSANLIAGGAGDLDLDALAGLLDRHLTGVPANEKRFADVSADGRSLEGVDVLLVDKPDRTQTQIFLGHPGLRAADADYFPFLLANHAFGGMFTSPLMQEVRVKRGWSYGASSRLEVNRGRGLAGVWTFPANDDTIPCVRLLLDLLADFQKRGVGSEELEAARGHLLNTLAFEVETPEQLVQRRIHELLLDLPGDWTRQFVTNVESTTLDEANRAAGRVIHTEALALVLVCTASKFVPALQEMPEVRRIQIVPFDTEDPSRWTIAYERKS